MGGYDDYPELYTRWFEYGAFQPNFRTHGSRRYNEVWSYGKQAEPILEKYLRLRYQLMPYIYSLGYQTHQTGAPYMRALFMDFPQDAKVADIGDEYMFGPAFLVAPVTEQGATSRMVYLPAGTDWYNYWTKEITGGQTVRVDAPIDTLPLFVRAGSILPLGEAVENTGQVQKLAKIRVYPGATAGSPCIRMMARPTLTNREAAASPRFTGMTRAVSSHSRGFPWERWVICWRLWDDRKIWLHLIDELNRRFAILAWPRSRRAMAACREYPSAPPRQRRRSTCTARTLPPGVPRALRK